MHTSSLSYVGCPCDTSKSSRNRIVNTTAEHWTQSVYSQPGKIYGGDKTKQKIKALNIILSCSYTLVLLFCPVSASQYVGTQRRAHTEKQYCNCCPPPTASSTLHYSTILDIFQEHHEQCCIDTLPRGDKHRRRGETRKGSSRLGPEIAVGEVDEGGRGLCFRHAFQRYSVPPDREALGNADAVYFGSGLHFLHMCRPAHPVEGLRVRG